MSRNSVNKKKRRAGGDYQFWDTPEGARLSHHRLHGCRSDLPWGCGVASLEPSHLQSLRELCGKIREETVKFVAWGDGFYDKKERGYAMVPELSAWKSVDDLIAAGILLHDADASESKYKAVKISAAKKHKITRDKAFTQMTATTTETEALEAVVQLAAEIVNKCDAADPLQPYEKASVRMQNLVAIQPNFHNGDDYLPLHVDNPRHDGFGVVIVTVALWGSAEVVLVDDGDPEEGGEGDKAAGAQRADAGYDVSDGDRSHIGGGPASGSAGQQDGGSRSWVFELRPGQLYVLSGHARNKCAHGIVVLPAEDKEEEENEVGQPRIDSAAPDISSDKKGAGPGAKPGHSAAKGRVSLNLRFGLHTAEQAHQDIDRHWG